MNVRDAGDRDNALDRLMIEYDAALELGQSGDTWHDSVVDLDSEVAAEWDSVKNCLELLDRARRSGVLPYDNGIDAAISYRRIGRYEVERELGRGGLGIVLLARDPQLDRKVALKIPRFDALGSNEFRRRFLREAEVAARLNHPRIVTLLEVGQEGPLCYLASEYCDGPTLAEWLSQRTRPADPHCAAGLILELAHAVEHAHGRGVLHRDIKPANVLLIAGGLIAGSIVDTELNALVPKLTDFGMAKLIERSGGETRAGVILGTLAYMSPEQAEGRLEALDARTDIYSLGAILFELLTGRPPYLGQNDLDTLRQLILNDPVSPRSVRREIPRDLEAIAIKCLAKQPTDRYATAHELAEDLNRFLSGEPTLARPLGLFERSTKWARRHPAVAALVTVCGACAIAVLGMSAVYNTRVQRALDESRQLLYAADMSIAFDAWQHANMDAVQERLNRHFPMNDRRDLRTFPWHFLWRQCNGDQHELYRHTKTIYAVAYSPDGRFVATGGLDELVYLWNVADGKIDRTLRGHKGDINDLAFSPDGKLLAATGDDNTVRIWSVDSANDATVLKKFTFSDVNALAFSPDGSWLAAASQDRRIYLWNAMTWELERSIEGSAAANRLAFSPDGRLLLASDSGGTARIITAESGSILFTLDPHEDPRRRMGAVAFSHDGRLASTASFEHRTIHLWDPKSGTLLKSLRIEDGWIHALAFSPDDQWLITGHENGGVRILNVETLETMHLLLGHAGEVRDLAVSPNGKCLITGGADGVVKAWDLSTVARRETMRDFDKRVEAVAYRPDGDMLAIEEHFGNVSMVDSADQSLRFQTTISRHDAPSFLVYSQDGRRLAFSIGDGRRIALFDVQSYKTVAELGTDDARIHTAAFSPDGKFIATGDSKSMLTLWDTKSATSRLACDTKQEEIFAIAYLSNATRIATSGHNGVKLWNAQTLQGGLEMQGCSDKVGSLAITTDGRLLAAATVSGQIRVWDLRESEPRATLVGHRQWVNSICFSPDNKTLASAGQDGTIRFWDVRTMQEVGVFTPGFGGRAEELPAICFSPDGLNLAVGSKRPQERGRTYVWSTAN